MNILRTPAFRAFALSMALPLAALIAAGCDVESTDSTSSVISDNDGNIYNFAGLYARANTNGLFPLVFPTNKQSGVALTWLRLLQYGSVLEAYDNAGLTWAGSISSLQSGTASFSLQGQTTAGLSVEIVGTLVYDEGDTSPQAVMDAAWIEPSFSGNLYAQATVAPAATNSSNSKNVTISPSSATLTTNGAVKSFDADGGDGSYVWSYIGGNGSLSSTSGSSITFTRNSSGSGVLTVTSDNDEASASISCP